MTDRLRVDVLGPIRALDATDRDVTPDGRAAAAAARPAGAAPRSGRVGRRGDRRACGRPSRHGTRSAALQNHLFRLRRGLPDGVIESIGRRLPARPPSTIDLDVDRLAACAERPRPVDPAAPGDDRRGPRPLARSGLPRARRRRRRPGRVASASTSCGSAPWRRGPRAGSPPAITDGLVAELAALADEEPLRERPRALLMAALATTGRSVEALRVYDDFRRLLGDELGIEPSPALAAQHADLLGGADAAPWAPDEPAAGSGHVARRPRRRSSPRWSRWLERHRLVTLVGPGGVGKTRLLGRDRARGCAARAPTGRS